MPRGRVTAPPPALVAWVLAHSGWLQRGCCGYRQCRFPSRDQGSEQEAGRWWWRSCRELQGDPRCCTWGLGSSLCWRRLWPSAACPPWWITGGDGGWWSRSRVSAPAILCWEMLYSWSGREKVRAAHAAAQLWGPCTVWGFAGGASTGEVLGWSSCGWLGQVVGCAIAFRSLWGCGRSAEGNCVRSGW